MTASSAYEESLRESLVDAPQCLRQLGGTTQWTKFDAIQFSLGLHILERIASFFRIRANLWLSCSSLGGGDMAGSVHGALGATKDDWRHEGTYAGLSAGMLAVDMEDLMYTFQSTASFYLKIRDPSATDCEENSWLMEPESLSRPALSGSRRGGKVLGLHAGVGVGVGGEGGREGFRLLLHATESLFCAIYNLVAVSSAEERRGWVIDITACLHIAETFPPHSFMRQVARCLDEAVQQHSSGSGR